MGRSGKQLRSTRARRRSSDLADSPTFGLLLAPNQGSASKQPCRQKLAQRGSPSQSVIKPKLRGSTYFCSEKSTESTDWKSIVRIDSPLVFGFDMALVKGVTIK